MKRRILVLTVAVLLALSTLACNVVQGLVEKATEATPAPAEVVEEQKKSKSDDEKPQAPDQPVNIEIKAGKMPEGYPDKEIPIYEPGSSEILGGFRQDIDGKATYNLVIGSNDDPETVTKVIRDKFKAESDEFTEMSFTGDSSTLGGVKGKWEYVINTQPGTEEDGYETLVTYMAIEK